ncbi:sigma-70 family RNA polymerase sigma factor [Fulvivirga kasyanovii]|uniref:Sigma-70 family RNA polymerase sigma factor n=1 Tax=Fulvivirga kasyanovii TaxID=396812 RepID=A0ABW9RN28_9BACT|nr:sigma-70 family RNA polymerase sigma factor [Fulvivirga kasyanovii]MTI25509.1 sigma-70 family RNA polymerase sigma factor [Fulvivirga kasyanovii]
MDKDKILDELLIYKCRDGDQKAFGLLIKRWNRKLISFAYKFIRDMDSARDVAQESWLSIHKGLNKLNDPAKFSTWAFRIVYNKSMDHLRSQQKQSEIEASTNEVANDELDDYHTDATTVSELLGKLPVQHKTVLTLFYLEQQSIRDIASILKLPEGTVKSRIFYARELLKRKYKELKNETH